MGDISNDRHRLSNTLQSMVLPRLVLFVPAGARHRATRVPVRVTGNLRLRWHMRGARKRFAMSPVRKHDPP
jgi:hypothetical protein